MLTFSELERLAYIGGFPSLADKYQKCADFDNAQENTYLDVDDTLNDQVDDQIAVAVEKQCPNYAEYKQFFETCFEMLDGRYPCPSVTSDYDCSVIFNAISKGEENRIITD